MWQFEHIDTFWWYLTIPVIAFLFIYIKRKREQKLVQIGSADKVKSLMQSGSPQQLLLKKLLWLTAVMLIILAMTNPQSGSEEETVTNVDSNIIVALDLSNSMLAKDIAPSRLEVSKKFLSNLVESLGGDRIAFIVFAGKAYIQMPFTTDYGAFEMQLNSVNTDMMPTQGTALGDAIQLAESMKGNSQNKQKILVLLSDGEDHDSKAVNIAKMASSNNMIIHTIGVGTKAGAPIPDKSMAGGQSYKRDRQGELILSRLNENTLKEIASAGGGKYFNITSSKQALKEINRSVKWTRNKEGEKRVYTRYKSYFQWFLFPAIILLMFELAGIHVLSFRNKNKTTNLLLILLLGFLISCTKKNESIKADELFKTGEYAASLENYRAILSKDSAGNHVYNFGVALQMNNKEDSSLIIFDQVIQGQADSVLKAQSSFNKGCILFHQMKYKEASEQFVNSLKFLPNNYRAQYNLSLSLAHIPPQQEQPEQQDKNQKDNQKDNQENKDNQDKKDQQNQDKQEDKKDNKSDKKDKEKDNNKKEDSEDKQKNNEQDKPQQGDKNETKQQQAQKGNLSQQDLQRLFQALDQQEKGIQKRIKTLQNGDKSNQPYIEKDW